MNKTFRLQTKLLTVVSLVIITIALVSSTVITMIIEKNITRKTFTHMEQHSAQLSRRIGQNMYNSNWRTLQINLDIKMKNDSNIIYYFIQDLGDTILLARDETVIGTRTPLLVPSPSENSTAYNRGSFRIRSMTLLKDAPYKNELRGVAGEKVFDTSRVLTHAGEPIGILRIGYSLKTLNSIIRSLRVNTILTNLSILIPVLGCILFIVRKHTTPLSQITRELSKLKHHESFRSIPGLLENIDLNQIRATTTETQELKDAFKEMKKLLVENWTQLENHRNHLEENVEERTSELRWANLKLRQEIQERTRIEENLQLQNKHMEALHQTTLDLIGHLETEKLLKTVLVRAGRLLGSENGYLYRYNPENDTLEFVAGLGVFTNAFIPSIRPGEGFIGRVWKKDRPLHGEGYAAWEESHSQTDIDAVWSVVGVPIKFGDSISGVIGLGFEKKEHPVSDEEVDILSRFAELASIALNNASLHTKIQAELKERKRIEEEKERLSHHLLQAQKLESLGTLAGGVAHDMNNLLMAIQGNVSLMLMNTEPDDPSYERGRNLQELVNSGSALTSQLLGFARSGKYNAKPENINAIVRKSLSMFGRTRKEISIHESCHEGVLTVDVDANQIEQVLLNILLNASHAMPGGGDLYIRTEPVELDDAFVAPHDAVPGNYVIVSVRDTGIGMDEKTLSKIFDPFFTTREMGRGTGLGLASTYGIVKNHNGIIAVTSEPGVGTTLHIYLALSTREVVPETETAVIVEKGKETILVIDDEPAIREITMEMLRELGYRCLTAENGRKGVELYKQHPGEIDLVLLDMIMPDEGGDIVYRNLTAGDPLVKVILSSGYSLEGEAKKIISAGCNGFIQKPFTLYELSESIRRVLAGGNEKLTA